MQEAIEGPYTHWYLLLDLHKIEILVIGFEISLETGVKLITIDFKQKIIKGASSFTQFTSLSTYWED